MASRKPKDWLNQEADAAVAVSEPEPPDTETASTPEKSNWSAELARNKSVASAALEALDNWHRQVSKLQSQLDAAKAAQESALADHSSDSEERMELIAKAQLREQVIAADLEHVRRPRNQLVNSLREAAKRCWPPATALYNEERARRVADALEELRQTLDPGIVDGLERTQEPGHAESMFPWPSMLQYAAARHSSVRAIDALKVNLPNFDSFSQPLTDEELGYLIAAASNFLQAIGKLQAAI
jgi:hypothetical protein